MGLGHTLTIVHVRETLKEMVRTEALIEGLKGLTRGSISLATMSGLAANIVPRAAVEFHIRNPRVKLKLRLMTTGEQILTAVEKGEVDLGLGFDFPRRQKVRLIHAVVGRLGAVMRVGHPLAKAVELRLSDCAGYPLVLADDTTAIRPYIDQAFSRSHLEPFVFSETNSIEIMRNMAMTGQTITFLTPFDIESERRSERLVHVPVQELRRHTQQLMLLESERCASGLAGVFAERLKALMNEADRNLENGT